MAIDNPQTPPDYDLTRIAERSDGFYWQPKDSGKTFGPFATLAEAIEDMEYADGNLEDGEPLEEAESDIGIADWIDPDTGEPAEDSVPHIEDH
jgi:hypothetical protein